MTSNWLSNALVQLGKFEQKEAEKTSDRFYNYLLEMFKDNTGRIKGHFKAVEESDYDQLIIFKRIDLWIACPHHLLPVELSVDVCYAPNGKILGASKFARIAKDLAFPMTQEEYTKKLVDVIFENLKPKFTMVRVVGRHDCMRSRGVKVKDTDMTTNAFRHTSEMFSETINSYKMEFLDEVRK